MQAKQLLSLITVTTSLAIATASYAANEKVMMILDESGSMWGQIDGKSKIEIAQTAIGGLLNDWKSNVELGVMAYGHREKGSCDDIELIAPVGAVDAGLLSKKINALQPKGKTPIAAALRKAAEQLKSTEEKATVILVSDGLETCDADPCSVAKELNEAGVDFTTHVVGFDLKDDELKQLKCIADNTGGTLIGASGAKELNEALGKVKQAVVEKAPEPEPEPKKAAGGGTWFEDSFDGSSLASDWQVLNENADNYVVDDGKLTIVFASDAVFPGEGNTPNIFKLNKGMPDGDWVATMHIIPEVQTMRERYHFGMQKDAKNGLIADAGNTVECCGYHAILSLWSRKINNGAATQFTQKLFQSEKLGSFKSGTENVKNFTNYVEQKAAAVEMRITKSSREYVVAARVQNDKGVWDEWKNLEKLNSLKLPGDAFVMAFNQVKFSNTNYQVQGGESIVHVDWIKIESN